MVIILAYEVFQSVVSMGSLLFEIEFAVMFIKCFAFVRNLVIKVYELVTYNNTLDDKDEDFLEEFIWENRAIYIQGFETIFFKGRFLLHYSLYSILPLSLWVAQYHYTRVFCLKPSASMQIYQITRLFTKSWHLEDRVSSLTEEELAVADHMFIICRKDIHFPETFANERVKPFNPRKHPKPKPPLGPYSPLGLFEGLA